MKKAWKMILTGVLLISVTGCGSIDVSKSEDKFESQTFVETQIEKAEETKKVSEDQLDDYAWIDLGFDGEVNANAQPELALDWWETYNDVYIPVKYRDKDKVDKPYTYLYWDTERDILDVEPPKDVYGLPDFFLKKTYNWNMLFSNDATLNTNYDGEIQMDIDDQKVKTINGAEFLRVEGTVHLVREDKPEANKSQKYIAYYGLLVPQEESYMYKDNVKTVAENAQVVLIMGDTSENQDKFDDVCKIADSIMETYRIKER